MKRAVTLLVLLLAFATPSFGQSFADSMIRSYERGVRMRIESEQHEADMEVRRLRAELLKLQIAKEANLIEQLQQLIEKERKKAVLDYIQTDIVRSLKSLLRRYPDAAQYEAEMVAIGGKIPMPDDFTLFDYVEMLYLRAKEKRQPQSPQ